VVFGAAEGSAFGADGGGVVWVPAGSGGVVALCANAALARNVVPTNANKAVRFMIALLNELREIVLFATRRVNGTEPANRVRRV
jgi:hypothetical protein